ILCVVLAACDTDPVGDDDDDDPFGRDPIPIPIVGHGVVPERITAEVAARSTWAYTTTWGQRVGRVEVGNALKVWDVSGATPQLVDSAIVEDAFTLGDVQISDDGSILVVATEGPNGSIVVF